MKAASKKRTTWEVEGTYRITVKVEVEARNAEEAERLAIPLLDEESVGNLHNLQLWDVIATEVAP